MDAVQFKTEVFCWRDLLYRLALRLLNNASEAEDAVQHIMMKMWQKKDELNDVENLRAFVIKALQNDCLNRLKQKQRKKTNTFFLIAIPLGAAHVKRWTNMCTQMIL